VDVVDCRWMDCRLGCGCSGLQVRLWIQWIAGLEDFQGLQQTNSKGIAGSGLSGFSVVFRSVVSGLQVSGLQVSGLQVSGMQISGLQVSGMQISGLQISGLQISGMQDVDCRQWIAVDLLDSSGLWIVDCGSYFSGCGMIQNDVRTSGF